MIVISIHTLYRHVDENCMTTMTDEFDPDVSDHVIYSWMIVKFLSCPAGFQGKAFSV